MISDDIINELIMMNDTNLRNDGYEVLKLAMEHEISVHLIELMMGYIDMNYQDDEGYTIVMKILRYWSEHVKLDQHVKLLLDQDFDVNLQNLKFFETALMIALQLKVSGESVKYLINKNFKPDLQNKHGETVLMQAIKKGLEDDMIKLIIKRGVNPDLRNKHGMTVLMLAVNYRAQLSDELIEILINRGYDSDLQDEKGRNTAMIAIESGLSYELTRKLIENQRNHIMISKDGYTLLMLAVKHGLPYDIIKYLIEKSSKIENYNVKTRRNLIMCAILSYYGDIEEYYNVIKLLFDHKYVFNRYKEEDYTVLMLAVVRFCGRSVEDLLGDKYEYDVHVIEKTVQNRVYEEKIIVLLIEHFVGLNQRCQNGRTALMYAILYNNNRNVIKILLDHKCNLDIICHNGYNALLFAVKEQKKDYINMLLEAGADPTVRDVLGNTALMLMARHSASYSDETILKIVSSSKSIINLRNHENLDALALAACNTTNGSSHLMVDILLKNNAGCPRTIYSKYTSMGELLHKSIKYRKSDIDTLLLFHSNFCGISYYPQQNTLEMEFHTMVRILNMRLHSYKILKELPQKIGEIGFAPYSVGEHLLKMKFELFGSCKKTPQQIYDEMREKRLPFGENLLDYFNLRETTDQSNIIDFFTNFNYLKSPP